MSTNMGVHSVGGQELQKQPGLVLCLQEPFARGRGDVIEVYYGDNRFGTMTDSGTATLKPRPRVRPLLTFLPLSLGGQNSSEQSYQQQLDVESTAVSTNTAGPGAVFNPAEIPPCCLQKPQVFAAGFNALLPSFSPVELTFLKGRRTSIDSAGKAGPYGVADTKYKAQNGDFSAAGRPAHGSSQYSGPTNTFTVRPGTRQPISYAYQSGHR
ncbi:Uncharacterized protein C6orf132 [Anas platyrhynchos]|uniref:Uncharacterized protein C6orf132 n=1 Tax=Anas platyrhynchos TaxID=8839 RepID=R0LE20_ANAPL|nr:Uncharacterized protein C6orf132 [Anas platyrhynchos]